jgi:hypothetical protein
MDYNLEISLSEKKLEIAELDAFEQQFKLKLPAEYKDFILQFNGGKPNKDRFSTQNGKIWVDFFDAIKYGDYPLEETLKTMKLYEQILPEHLFPIGYDPGGNQICISLAEVDYGTMFMWYANDPDNPIRNLAPSFSYFINHLEYA